MQVARQSVHRATVPRWYSQARFGCLFVADLRKPVVRAKLVASWSSIIVRRGRGQEGDDTVRQRILKALLASATALLTACSGYESTPTTPNPTPAPTATPAGGTATVDFTGTTRALGPTSCGGDSHQFVAAEGTITVLLVRTTGNASLVAQVCAGGIDDNDCSLKQTVIAVARRSPRSARERPVRRSSCSRAIAVRNRSRRRQRPSITR